MKRLRKTLFAFIMPMLLSAPLFSMDYINLSQHFIFSKFPSFQGLTGTDTEEEIFEWIDLLEAIEDAKDQFVMIEVGAGMGRWGGRGGAVASTRNLPYHIFFVEAEPYRAHVGIHEEMMKIGIPSANYQIFDVGVGAINKSSFFYVSKGAQTLDTWLGQCIVPDQDPIAKWLKQEYYGRPLVETRNGYVATRVDERKFSEILNAIESPIIDLCDMDIQGNEFIVIQEAMEIINRRIKCLHIGTHSNEIEAQLRTLLQGNGWRLIRDYPLARVNATEYGNITFVDGVQTWHNTRLK